MDRLTHAQLLSLAAHCRDNSVTISMPLVGNVAESQQDSIRLRNLAKQAEDALKESGMRGPDAKELLKPVHDLVHDGHFWHSDRALGLVILVAPGVFHAARLPDAVTESVVVDNRFQITGLLYSLRRDDRFLLLTLSPKNIRLYTCSSQQIVERPLPKKMPHSLDEYTAGTEIERSVQYHSSGPGSPAGSWVGTMHGQNDLKDVEKTLFAEYVRAATKHIDDAIKTEHVPLVLAAVEAYHPVFREVCSYPHLLERGVVGSPDKLSEHELLQRALPVVEPEFQRVVQQVIERYRKISPSEQARESIKSIIPAAIQGRVDTLLAAYGHEVWGKWDENTGDVQTRESRQNGDVELVNQALIETLNKGGAAYVVDASDLPGNSPVAAVLRW